MDWKHWYRELEQDDETWDVSEEVVLRGVWYILIFAGIRRR
ncbi:hypothetical protein ABFY57_00245 [Paenibacillus polymyxa]